MKCHKLCQPKSGQRHRRISVGEQSLPGSGALIKALLADGDEAAAIQQIGTVNWWYLSGVSHAVNFALLKSIQAPEEAPTVLQPLRAAIFTSSRSVSLQGVILGLGFQTLIEAHRDLFGWVNGAWEQAVAQFGAQASLAIATAETTLGDAM